jgi:hypothetical protein
MERNIGPGSYCYADETRVLVEADAATLFAHLDDPRQLGAHMTRRSPMMAGGRMDYVLDERGGRGVGAVIGMHGRALGWHLAVEEVVDTYEPGFCKVWHTVGQPRLLVIGSYRMGFDELALGALTELRTFIQWSPVRGWYAPLVTWLGARYARWCIASLARDAQSRFQAMNSLAVAAAPHA